MNSKEENSCHKSFVWISSKNSASVRFSKALSVLGLGSLIDLTEVDDSSVFLGGLSFKVFLSM